ncbi:hypothetical protein PG988_010952 [Apiospora saccharicola]
MGTPVSNINHRNLNDGTGSWLPRASIANVSDTNGRGFVYPGDVSVNDAYHGTSLSSNGLVGPSDAMSAASFGGLYGEASSDQYWGYDLASPGYSVTDQALRHNAQQNATVNQGLNDFSGHKLDSGVPNLQFAGGVHEAINFEQDLNLLPRGPTEMPLVPNTQTEVWHWMHDSWLPTTAYNDLGSWAQLQVPGPTGSMQSTALEDTVGTRDHNFLSGVHFQDISPDTSILPAAAPLEISAPNYLQHFPHDALQMTPGPALSTVSEEAGGNTSSIPAEKRRRHGQDEIRNSLRTKLLKKQHDNESELLDNAINLAASLLLMCNFGTTPLGFSGRTELGWTQGTLQDFLADHFGKPPVPPQGGIKLEKTFVARNLNQIGSIEIIWTENLIDHLHLSDNNTKVQIFHHASFLEYQKHSLLPDGLAAETLQTLALLFPSMDRETNRWLSRHPSIDRRLGRCGQLKTELRQFDRSHFWRDRLIVLKQAYDEAQPKTLRNWWYDRRNGVQWYTFWIAMLVLFLTIVFGLIQCVEGALQVYASFKSLEG